jgi:glycerol-3-phosphate acyltransferase PlsY
MSPWSWSFVLILSAYVIGGIPFGWLIGYAHGIDIRRSGSGNIGATNVGRLLGKKWGIVAFLLDTLKGFLPTLLAGRVLDRLFFERTDVMLLIWLAIGSATIMGHNYSLFLGFKGGKGVATSLGVTLGVYPDLTWPGLIAFGVWFAVVFTSRYVSLGSIAAGVAFPILVTFWPVSGPESFADRWPLCVFAWVLGLLVVVRHRANLVRLRSGTEPKIGRKPVHS